MRVTGKSSSMDEKPREVPVSHHYLDRFQAPLWQKLDLENCKAISAIEGKRGGCHFIILDVEHACSELSRQGRGRSITTFFIGAIPESVGGRHVSWRPGGYQVSADGMYVYLAQPGRQARPAQWRKMVEATLKTARSLTTRAEAEHSGLAGVPTYEPVGPGAPAHVFWALAALGFAVLLFVCGLGTMFGLIDYRPDCFPNAAAAECMTVWRVEKAFMEGATYLLGAAVFLAVAWYHRERARKRLPRKPEPKRRPG